MVFDYYNSIATWWQSPVSVQGFQKYIDSANHNEQYDYSVYYDIITLVGWSLGSEHGVYINGDDESMLANIMNETKLIVTFNGT